MDNAEVDAYGGHDWSWDQSAGEDFLRAPRIWHTSDGQEGSRYCRKLICK